MWDGVNRALYITRIVGVRGFMIRPLCAPKYSLLYNLNTRLIGHQIASGAREKISCPHKTLKGDLSLVRLIVWSINSPRYSSSLILKRNIWQLNRDKLCATSKCMQRVW